MAEFLMPQLGADMSAGKLLRWRKHVGDRVQRGDIIADVETEKADIEVEVFTTGVIESFVVQPGQRVPVGTVLALIREEGKPLAAGAPPVPITAVREPAPATPAVPPPLIAMPQPVGETAPSRLRISPAARKLAADLGVNLASLVGTGPAGRITLEDVRHAVQAQPLQPAAEVPLEKSARMRQAIAAAMARSKREIPHYYLSTTIDMSRSMSWLTQENIKRTVEDRLIYGVLLLKAVALALREVPELNSLWKDGSAMLSGLREGRLRQHRDFPAKIAQRPGAAVYPGP